MPLYQSNAGDCLLPSVRREGNCVICQRHLCITHLKPPFHKCPSYLEKEEREQHFKLLRMAERQEVADLISRVNVVALRDRAITLRNVPCEIPDLTYDPDQILSIMGGMNYHISIIFADGVTWLCRVRRSSIRSTPLAHQNRLIVSEAATYRFLSTHTTVPVPRVHDYSLNLPTNPVGVVYILMDRFDGRPLSHYTLTDENRYHVWNQLADIFSALQKHPFTAIGCLNSPEDLSVGPILEDTTVDYKNDGSLDLIGPFSSALKYRQATVQRQIEQLLRGEVNHANAIDAYLAHRLVLDHVLSAVFPSDDGKYYLKHMDDKCDHILVGNAFNIVGIVDWEWAQMTPHSDAFSAPLYLLDVANHYDGSNALSREEVEFASFFKERKEFSLESAIQQGRISHRLAHCIAGDIDHFMGLWKAVFPDDKRFEFWEQIREFALREYADDAGLMLLST